MKDQLDEAEKKRVSPKKINELQEDKNMVEVEIARRSSSTPIPPDEPDSSKPEKSAAVAVRSAINRTVADIEAVGLTECAEHFKNKITKGVNCKYIDTTILWKLW